MAMKKYWIPLIILLLPGIIYLVLFNTTPVYKPLPHLGSIKSITEKGDTIREKVDVLELIDIKNGNRVSSTRYDSMIRIIYFFHPESDFVVSQGANLMEKVQGAIYQADPEVVEKITDNVKVIGVCVDENWSVADMDAYRKKYEAKDFWHLYKMNAGVNASQLEKSFCIDDIPLKFLSNKGLPFYFLVDANGYLRGYYNARRTSATEDLQEAIHVLLREEIVPMKFKE